MLCHTCFGSGNIFIPVGLSYKICNTCSGKGVINNESMVEASEDGNKGRDGVSRGGGGRSYSRTKERLVSLIESIRQYKVQPSGPKELEGSSKGLVN